MTRKIRRRDLYVVILGRVKIGNYLPKTDARRLAASCARKDFSANRALIGPLNRSESAVAWIT